MLIMNKYFKITNFYDKPLIKGRLIASQHIVRADNADEALRIFNQHKIRPIPDGIKLIKQTVRDLMDIGAKDYSDWILSPMIQGMGGSVWYEDENGNLQKEKLNE